ncbi:helicase HerA-like domain-containing protein [Streptomyces sp. NBC_01497]|uniref:helicase HerA-like domain-containing protein n=1 Tax=Streptomyces sp. NBC_01497 TaxID=2903885 RepID=UPI002E303E17|nr:helicase HerA-like domain-containing protein [Streptomyces sp. NBC_01497]
MSGTAPSGDLSGTPGASIAAAYGFTGPALEIGTLLWDGVPRTGAPVRMPLATLNRHGLIAGGAATGRETTRRLMVRQLSAQAVPVFLADMASGASGPAGPDDPAGESARRAAEVGRTRAPAGAPAAFLTPGGVGPGMPVRATVTSFGPVLLSTVLGLDRTQERALGLVLHYADGKGLELLDLGDLRAVVAFLVSDSGRTELQSLGGISTATAGAILRSLAVLEQQGGGNFFGAPEFDTTELPRVRDGRGHVRVLRCAAVPERPQLVPAFLMWLLAGLFHDLPDAGDVERPKLVFFFDEAHALFRGASAAFLESVNRTLRLLGSKGVSVFFVTRTPQDVPPDVLAQLGNRVQHALGPEDTEALKATVHAFPTSAYDLEEVLTGLGTGEAVVTALGGNGVPLPVAVTRLHDPAFHTGPTEPCAATAASPLHGGHAGAVGREPPCEKPTAEQRAAEENAERAVREAEHAEEALRVDRTAPGAREQRREPEVPEPSVAGHGAGSGVFTTLARSVGTPVGPEITRSVLGTARRR